MSDPKPDADRFCSLRDRAEKRLREALEVDRHLDPGETLHRIELELQNEDLLRANRQLEALRDNYRKLFDFAPLGYCLLDHEGLILDANLEAARLFGVGRALLPGLPYVEFLAMDEGLSRAVREVFVRLYEEGLIYRGDYIINWCPRCHTALADLEVEYAPHIGKLYHIRYPVEGEADTFLTVATTRPETMAKCSTGTSATPIPSSSFRHYRSPGGMIPPGRSRAAPWWGLGQRPS